MAITDFYNQWIGTSRLDIMTKSTMQFPTYSDAVRDAMKAETPAFVEYVLWTGDRKLETLLTSPMGFVSSALAPIYGVTASSTTPQMVTLPAAQGRAGILTQAGFLAVQAHPDQTSPVLRGKFVRTKLMCQTVPPPPMDVDITPPAITAAATARERFAAHESAGTSCKGCHQLMDPIGLAFETFDAVGKYRSTENGATIDVSGAIVGIAGSGRFVQRRARAGRQARRQRSGAGLRGDAVVPLRGGPRRGGAGRVLAEHAAGRVRRVGRRPRRAGRRHHPNRCLLVSGPISP